MIAFLSDSLFSAVSTTILATAGALPDNPGLPAVGRGAWMPRQSSEVAAEVDFVFNFITWISIVFFVAIVILTLWLSWKYRRREGYTPEKSSSHNTPLELAWTIVPLFLVIAIFYVGMQGFVKLREAPVGAYEVEVTGSQWNWNFLHPGGMSDGQVLDVPLGKPVRLIMKSEDVLHSLFIPAFRVKQDVVPGRYTELWFTPSEPGVYDLFCTEYCGNAHSTMLAEVHVWPEDQFEAKVAEKAAIFDEGKAQDWELPYLAAQKLYSRCKSCHTADGSRLTGPSFKETYDLFKAGESRVLTSGEEVLVDRQYIYDSIKNPTLHVVETYGAVMPNNFGVILDERKIDALVRMLIQFDDVMNPDGTPKAMVPPPAGESDDTNAAPAEGENNS